jgi:hypothetical protein
MLKDEFVSPKNNSFDYLSGSILDKDKVSFSSSNSKLIGEENFKPVTKKGSFLFILFYIILVS